MKGQCVKCLVIGVMVFGLVFVLMARSTWAATSQTGDDAIRQQQEYIKRIVTNPSGTWIEYMQRTSLADLWLTGTVYPEITYRVQMPNIFPNWGAPSIDYTEYSPIGGIGGIQIFPGLWDLIGWGGGIWSGGGSPWWGSGITGGTSLPSSQWGYFNPGSFWFGNMWDTYSNPSNFLY